MCIRDSYRRDPDAVRKVQTEVRGGPRSGIRLESDLLRKDWTIEDRVLFPQRRQDEPHEREDGKRADGNQDESHERLPERHTAPAPSSRRCVSRGCLRCRQRAAHRFALLARVTWNSTARPHSTMTTTLKALA